MKKYYFHANYSRKGHKKAIFTEPIIYKNILSIAPKRKEDLRTILSQGQAEISVSGVRTDFSSPPSLLFSYRSMVVEQGLPPTLWLTFLRPVS